MGLAILLYQALGLPYQLGMRSKLLLCLSLLILTLDCGGCVAKTAKSADDDQWVTLPPETGSLIGRRVRKSDLGKPDPSTTNVVTVSGEALNSVSLMSPQPKPGTSGPGAGP